MVHERRVTFGYLDERAKNVTDRTNRVRKVRAHKRVEDAQGPCLYAEYDRRQQQTWHVTEYRRNSNKALRRCNNTTSIKPNNSNFLAHNKLWEAMTEETKHLQQVDEKQNKMCALSLSDPVSFLFFGVPYPRANGTRGTAC